MGRLKNLQEAAQYLGIAPVTLRLYTYRGRIGFVQIGRRKLFDPEELDRFVREHTVSAHESSAPTRAR
jgi:excisionase family DNA binding protein